MNIWTTKKKQKMSVDMNIQVSHYLTTENRVKASKIVESTLQPDDITFTVIIWSNIS